MESRNQGNKPMLEVFNDKSKVFGVEIKGRNGVSIIHKAYIFEHSKEDKPYIMLAPKMLKSVYSDKDRAEQIAMQENVVHHGEQVIYNNQIYKVFIKGNYSDCGYLVED